MTLPILLALALGAAPSGADRVRVVLAPVDNAARSGEGAVGFEQHVADGLALRGYAVVRGEEVEAILRARRVRYLDSIPADALRELADRNGAAAVMIVSLLAWDRTGGTVAVSARLLGPDGACRWSGVTALASADTTEAFGRGRITDVGQLARVATGQLLETLPAPGELGRTRPVPRGSAGHVLQYRAPDLLGTPRRVAILPLDVVADEEASVARVVDVLLRTHLGERAGLEIVEPAEVRAALVAEGVRSLTAAPPEVLRRVGDRLGTHLFLRGAILRGLLDMNRTVELHVVLVDVAAGRVLWSALHERSRAEFEGLLGLGSIHASVAVADHVVLDLVEALYNGRGAATPPRASTGEAR